MKKNFFFVLSSLLMFTVGMYAQSETSVVMKDSFAVKGANYLPEGWIVCAGGNIKATGAAGSGPRIFSFPKGGDFTYGLYVRTENANDNDGYAIYGATDKWNINLLEGDKCQLSFNVAAWKNTPYLKAEIYDPNNNIIVSSIKECLPNLGSSTAVAISGSTKAEIDFDATETGKYILKFTPVANENGDVGGWLETMIGNIQIVKKTTQGVENVLSEDLLKTEYFEINGQTTDSQHKGIVIKKQTYNDGRILRNKQIQK